MPNGPQIDPAALAAALSGSGGIPPELVAALTQTQGQVSPRDLAQLQFLQSFANRPRTGVPNIDAGNAATAPLAQALQGPLLERVFGQQQAQARQQALGEGLQRLLGLGNLQSRQGEARAQGKQREFSNKLAAQDAVRKALGLGLERQRLGVSEGKAGRAAGKAKTAAESRVIRRADRLTREAEQEISKVQGLLGGAPNSVFGLTMGGGKVLARRIEGVNRRIQAANKARAKAGQEPLPEQMPIVNEAGGIVGMENLTPEKRDALNLLIGK